VSQYVGKNVSVGLVFLRMFVSVKVDLAGRIALNPVRLVDGAHLARTDVHATMVQRATLSLANVPVHQVGQVNDVTCNALTSAMARIVGRYASVKMAGSVTINLVLVAVLLGGGELCVTIRARRGLTEPIVRVLVCAKTKETATQLLEIAIVPWGGRVQFVPTRAPQAPSILTVKRSVTVTMAQCVIMSMGNATAFQVIKEQSAKNNVRMVGTDTTASRSANVKMVELATRLMGDVPALQVGRVHFVINAHVLALNSMDLIAR